MPYRTNETPTIDWNTIAREIAHTPGGLATLRILEVHGVHRLTDAASGAFTTIDYLAALAHNARYR